MIDYIGGKLISLRRINRKSEPNNICISRLSDKRDFELTGEEWLELCELIAGIDRAMRFSEPS